MPESIDWQPPHPPRRRRPRFLLILAVLAGIVFGGRTALSYYVGDSGSGRSATRTCSGKH